MDIYSQLERDEGKKNSAYADSEGFLTVGIGFMIDARKGGQLFDEEIDFILKNRVSKLSAVLLETFPWMSDLDPVRYAVVQNMAYNLGVAGLSKFVNFLDRLKNKDYAAASNEMLQSEWAKQLPLRSQRLSIQVRLGIWQ